MARNGRYCPNAPMILLTTATLRVVDVFVDAPNLAEMSFEGVVPAARHIHQLGHHRRNISAGIERASARTIIIFAHDQPPVELTHP